MAIDISRLTASEVWMILHPTRSKREDLLKYIIMDLVYKNVLIAKKERIVRKDGRTSQDRHLVISRGENYEGYKPLIHERKVFVQFKKKTNYLAKVLFKKLFFKTDNFKDIKQTMMTKALASRGYMSTFSPLAWFSIYNLTPKGWRIRELLKKKMDSFEKNVKVLKNEPEKLKEAVEGIGASVLLLQNINEDLSKEISKMIKDLHIMDQVGGSSSVWDSMGAMELAMDIMVSDFSFGGEFDDFGGFDGDF